MEGGIYFCTLFLISVVSSLTPQCSRYVDPCSSDIYVEIDDVTRGIGHLYEGSPAENDYDLRTDWYRSVGIAGGDMPTLPVCTGQCNSYAPIWLNGSLPRESDGIVDIPACASFLSNTCIREYTVAVKNCSSFNVYCLVHTHDAFDRFCFGTEVPCTSGTSTPTGYTPGCTSSLLSASGTDLCPAPRASTTTNRPAPTVIPSTTTTSRGTTDSPPSLDELDCPTDIDPCEYGSHSMLDDHTRSTGYTTYGSDTDNDYTLPTDWYRSVSAAGVDMPTSPVYIGQCAAYAPIWLTGNLPRRRDGIVAIRACASFLNNTCIRDYVVGVKKCRGFNVYCLTNTYDTFDRYCMGSESPCPSGSTSPTGFTPGCEMSETTDVPSTRISSTRISSTRISSTDVPSTEQLSTTTSNSKQGIVSGHGKQQGSMGEPGLVVALVISVVALIAILGLTLYCITRQNRNSNVDKTALKDNKQNEQFDGAQPLEKKMGVFPTEPPLRYVPNIYEQPLDTKHAYVDSTA